MTGEPVRNRGPEEKAGRVHGQDRTSRGHLQEGPG